ncbi:PorT family protein [Paraflavitalea soli]|uniref:PorT family protein n=1 Tax=Paraflavitalea soli TaxID=2315862 RepID=A0A3B7MF07_9BACT|nr:porin family protein [Paraflavitalea soli]AXY72902.1 PorT family protein [Paraflavitalea soli]
MKKYCVLILVLVAGCLTTYAQVKVGLKGGININNVKYRDADPNTASIGFNTGLLARIQVSDKFFIRPELQYSVKGYRYPVTGGSGNVTSRLNYINLPVLAGFPIGSKLQFLIGPEFGYLVKATSKFGGNKSDITNLYQHFDWGLDLGAAFHLMPDLGVEVRYNYGFRGLIKGITTDANGNPTGSMKDGANRVFQAGLFYML